MGDRQELEELRRLAELESKAQSGSASRPTKGATGSWSRGASGSWSDPRLSGKSGLEKYRMGGKVGFGDLKLGIDQIRGKATETDVDAARASNAGLLEDPVVRAGNTSAYVAASLPAMLMPLGNTILGSAALGGAFGGIQPVGTGESRLDNAINSAALSGTVTAGLKTVGRALQPIRNANTAEEQAAVDTLRREGVRMPVGAQTGSTRVRQVERALADNPYTGPAMADQAAKTARTFTRAALSKAGIDGEVASPQVLGNASDRIGNGMNVINSRYSLDINKFTTELTDLADEAQRILPDDGKRIILQVERIFNKAAANGGKLDATTAQKVRTELGKLSNDSVVGEYAVGLRRILDDALDDATKGTADFGKMAELRSQYRNLLAIARSTDTTANAQVSAARLASELKSGRYTQGSMRLNRGDTELSELARAGSTVADRFPNSGTGARVGAQLVAPTLVAGADYAANRDAGRAAKLAAMTYGLPKAAAFALNNPATANYLARGVPMPPVTNQLGEYLLRIAPPLATGLVASQ